MTRISGSGGGGGCFLGHTLVRTPDGQRAIETLQPGDLVVSFDDQGQLHHAKVLKVHEHEGERVVRYRLWGGKVLDATPNHWVLNQYNAFVEIGSLGPDDCLVDENDHLRPIVERSEFCVGTVYNLTVEGHHTFIAGGVRVHNAGLGAGKIAGSGGGGGKGGGGGSTHTPVEAADGLNSTQYATLIDLISEGEIQGLKDGHKSIYIDNTPLQNADNSYNFQNVSVYTRNGTQNQSFIPLAAQVENEIPVSVNVVQPTPVVRSVTDPDVDAVRVTLTAPSLQQFTSNGDIVGVTVQLEIAVQYSGGGYTTIIQDTLKGRTPDQYQRDYLVPLTGTFPVDIKVTRVTADSSSAKLINAFSWSSYTEITYAKLRYPNSALVGIRIDAEQFNSIPRRSYLVRGIKVAIPSNATVDSATGRLIYAGVWNGTFGAAQWTTDPAWCLWDLLTSTRYGFGNHIQAAQLDKWAFYSASVYASALVDNGLGGLEPRFSCNINIQTAEDAYKLINDMCSVFRAMPYWSAGALTISQDKPGDSAYLFTLANVSEEGFSYSGSSLKTRPNVAVVSYLDLNTRDIAYEVVEDTAAIAKYGAVTTEVSAFACTSRGQAQRIGEWLLYSEQYEGTVCSFKASIDAGVLVRPGQIIDISDPVVAGQRRGGRIAAATTTTVTVDDAAGLAAGNNRTLSVILPDGTVQTRNVSSISGKVVTVNAAFSTAPNANSVWIYQTDDIKTTQWRVISVQEEEGATYLINAVSYDASKYAYVESGTPLQARDVTNLNQLPQAPTNFTATEALYEYQSQVRAKVIVSWRAVVGINQYQVRWRKDNGNWTVLTVDGPDYEVLDITPGLFEFEIYSFSPGLKLSTSKLTGSINALGKTAPPSDVSGFAFTADKDIGVTLDWTAVPDIDVSTYEIRRGANWGTADVITQVSATTYKIGYLDNGAYTYQIKALDSSGVYSTNPATVTVTISGANATTISSSIQGSDLVLSWAVPALTTYAISYYRVTYGNSYATSTELAKTQSTSFTVPITAANNWIGARTFWVAPVDLVGKFTDPPDSEVVTIAGAAAPTVSSTAGGATVTLSWTAVAGTLPTASYVISRGGTVLATVSATTYSFRPDWIGSQTISVAARDVAGNLGTAGSAVVTINAAGAPTLRSSFAGQNIVFEWDPIKGTLDTDYYILKRGNTFNSAVEVAKIYSTRYTLKAEKWDPNTTTTRFWLAAVDVNNNEGTPDDQDVTITIPAAPAISQQVIDNNVLLRWNDVTRTLPIVYYELRRGSTWAGGAVIGTKQGGFTTVFETAAGTYTYWLAGIDSAGNYGTPGSVTAVVNQPPDYVLQLDQNSTWAGTETNIYTDAEIGQVVNVNTTETWQSHFTSRGWNTPQDQITAGYTYYLMPSTTTASYVEEFNYGTVLAGTKVTATLTSVSVAGSTTITPTISVRKLPTDAWTDYTGLNEIYATQFQYFKVRYDFTSADNNDLMLLTGLNVRLDSKVRNDAGSGQAFAAQNGTYSQTATTITVNATAHGLQVNDLVDLDFTTGTATDGIYTVATALADSFTVISATSATTSGNVTLHAGGQPVNFGVAFVDVESITVTPKGTSALVAVYDFNDAPNPTSFKVLLFNTSGTRVGGEFSWSAKGV